MESTTITPVALDMRLPDESLRETGRAAMRGTLTPMLAVHHHASGDGEMALTLSRTKE